MTMTGKERMRAATEGKPVDRPPIWVREGFDLHRDPPPRDHFSQGWRAEDDYLELAEFASQHCDMRVGWSAGNHFNRIIGIPQHTTRREVKEIDANTRRTHVTIDTPKGELHGISESHRGETTGWTVKHYVENMEDLDKLRSVPFEVQPVSFDGYERAYEQIGDRGVLCFGLSSPWVALAATMPYELALAWSASEREMMHELLEEVTQRYLAGLDAILTRPFDTIANIGGSEQCTPPMMGPDAYAEWVTPYDGRIVARLKKHGIPVNCHCHGRVRAALPEIVKMGFASTDPVEPPFGGGDLTIAEAREIVGDQLTLVGNLQFDELERSTPEQIEERVREIAATGPERLIISASAGPISKMTSRMIQNYRAWIEAATEISNEK